MRLSYDNQFLFTVGQDGLLFIYELKDKSNRAQKDDDSSSHLKVSEEILTEKSDIESQLGLLQSLEIDAKNMEASLSGGVETKLQVSRQNEAI
eukprot:CAMPEP_0116888520 /NCGR_PEP_ID=MMETSP0463-20121206/23582_1 /TAXON_ID=181622 /ORGANISM="Strombidinopsis sp, Strain SopsisLIS2011" /LENGTH=92 /DNA_ID=CAMNT_0004553447 /DNA_START=1862 /DNA_END=2140 /DNA_ORIENTATION=+